MKLLVLDVGITTGYCTFHGGEWVKCGTISSAVFDQQTQADDKNLLRDLLVGVDAVVVELPKLGWASDLGRRLRQVVREVERTISQSNAAMFEVKPGDWKPWVAGRFGPPQGWLGKTKHELDAYQIGVWWQRDLPR